MLINSVVSIKIWCSGFASSEHHDSYVTMYICTTNVNFVEIQTVISTQQISCKGHTAKYCKNIANARSTTACNSIILKTGLPKYRSINICHYRLQQYVQMSSNAESEQITITECVRMKTSLTTEFNSEHILLLQCYSLLGLSIWQ